MGKSFAAIASSALLLVATSAAAGSLDQACSAVDASSAAACKIEKSKADWTLTTNVLVGGGTKERVAAVEERFCETVQSLGVRGHVVRWNQVAGLASGAKMEWSCAAPAVSAAPRYRR
jgi:hypothetical protein